MLKLCSGSVDRKYFAGSLCLAAAVLTGLGAIDHGHHTPMWLTSDQCFAADALLTTINTFFGVLMLSQAARK